MTDRTDVHSVPAGVMVLVVTRGISAIGGVMLAFALDVWVYRQTGSYATFAYLSMITALPTLLLAPIGGVLVDRCNKKAILLACELASIAAILLIALQHTRGTLDLVSIAVATFTLAAAGNVRWIAMGVAITMLVPPRSLDRVNAIEQAFEGIVMVSGPLLGSAALALFGLTTIIVADLLSSVIAVATLGCLERSRLAPPPRPAGPAPALWTEVTFGVRWIWVHPALRRLLLFVVAYNIAGSLFITASTPFILAFNPNGVLALSLALEGAGALAVGVLLARFFPLLAPEKRVVLAAGLFGLLMLIWGMSRSMLAICVLSFTAGILTTMLIASLQTTWQTRVPVDIQGKVFATRRMVAHSMTPLSILGSVPAATWLFAPLAAQFPFTAVLWGEGAGAPLGMMLSALGAALLAGAIAFHLRGALYTSDTPAAPIVNFNPGKS